jgi:GH15 family glucan-1,4-alpha-glucosidase
VHTYSAAMCWAACDRLAKAGRALGLTDRAALWRQRADHIKQQIETRAWRPETQRLSATFSGDDLDASVIQLLDLRFLSPDDPRFVSTLAAVEEGLRRGSHMLRYATEDDFGLPQTAFNVCTFWLIEALHLTGREAEARTLFEEMLSRRTPAGLLSEDIDPTTGELWGNFPQTYSLVGIINCAVLLSKPWSAIR